MAKEEGFEGVEVGGAFAEEREEGEGRHGKKGLWVWKEGEERKGEKRKPLKKLGEIERESDKLKKTNTNYGTAQTSLRNNKDMREEKTVDE